MFLCHKHSWTCLLLGFYVKINMAVNCPNVSLTISIDVTRTNVETQSQTVVSGLAVFSPLT